MVTTKRPGDTDITLPFITPRCDLSLSDAQYAPLSPLDGPGADTTKSRGLRMLKLMKEGGILANICPSRYYFRVGCDAVVRFNHLHAHASANRSDAALLPGRHSRKVTSRRSAALLPANE